MANKQILEEASEWLVELTAEEPDSQNRAGFDAWLRQSPEHVRAYLELLPIWQQGAATQFARDKGPEALIAYARGDGNIVPLSEQARDVRSQPKLARFPFRRPVFAVAAALTALGLVFGWYFFLAGTTYSTGIGEQHAVVLSDGSTLQLNARSEVRVHFSDDRRTVRLIEGQALFRVAPDPARPFVVDIENTHVRAVGTQFDVNRKRKGTVIAVVEGKVAVSVREFSSSLSAGEQITIPQNTPATSPTARPANIAAVTAWIQRRLVFDDADLAEVVDEFNRYNTNSLAVAPALENFSITATFSSTDPASLLRFLKAQPGIEVVQARDGIQIRHSR